MGDILFLKKARAVGEQCKYLKFVICTLLLGKWGNVNIVQLSVGVTNPGDTKHYSKIYA